MAERYSASELEVRGSILLCMVLQPRVGKSSTTVRAKTLILVLLVADLFHPAGGFAVQGFRSGDMAHAHGRAGAVPVFCPWRDPYNIPRADLVNRAIPLLNPADSCDDNQGLAQWMRMPSSTRTRLKRDDSATDPSWSGGLEAGIS